MRGSNSLEYELVACNSAGKALAVIGSVVCRRNWDIGRMNAFLKHL